MTSVDPFWTFERNGWERAAAHYEEFWTDTILFIENLLDAAGVPRAKRLLDLACGPGYVSEAASHRGAEPIGIDVAPGMVERASRRCPGQRFIQGDAQQLLFSDESFDAVTINFGILHFSNPELALAESRRVLTPGGKLAFTVWVAEGNAAAQIADTAIATHGLPVQLPAGPGYYRFADIAECQRVTALAGFNPKLLEVETITKLWRVPTTDFLFEAELRAGVRTAAVLALQPRDRLENIRRTMAEHTRRYADADSFVLPLVARIVSCQRGS